MIYHGGYTAIEQPQIIEEKYAKDFGTGFYCTELKDQAIRWALRFETPVVSEYQLKIDKSLNMLEFNEMTEEWLEFIVTCRSFKP
jgi:hypothetical protein